MDWPTMCFGTDQKLLTAAYPGIYLDLAAVPLHIQNRFGKQIRQWRRA
jgi:hypothetical protein